MKNFLHPDKDFRFNEILFENRNKNYGAYVLRNEESSMLTKSLFIGIAIFGAISITPLLFNSFKTPPIIKDNFGPHILTPVDETPEKKPEIIKPITPVAPPKVNTYDSRIATPTRNANEPKPISKTDKDNAIPGTQTSLDNPPITDFTPPIVVAPVVNTPIVVAAPKVMDNSPVSVVDVEANFAAGINAFRNKVVQNFDTDSFDGSGDLLKTTVTFIVEKDGTISAIKAVGEDNKFNREAESTIKNIKGKWNPAKLNGQNVRSYFKFPISMQFE